MKTVYHNQQRLDTLEATVPVQAFYPRLPETSQPKKIEWVTAIRHLSPSLMLFPRWANLIEWLLLETQWLLKTG